MQLTFEPGDLTDPDVAAFLTAHLSDLAPQSPLESQHALDLDGLRGAGVRLWTGRVEGAVAATGALAELTAGHSAYFSVALDAH